MKEKVSKSEMKQVKGGFKPEFSVSVESDTRAFPQIYPACIPPPNTSYNCIRCESVVVGN